MTFFNTNQLFDFENHLHLMMHSLLQYLLMHCYSIFAVSFYLHSFLKFEDQNNNISEKMYRNFLNAIFCHIIYDKKLLTYIFFLRNSFKYINILDKYTYLSLLVMPNLQKYDILVTFSHTKHSEVLF